MSASDWLDAATGPSAAVADIAVNAVVQSTVVLAVGLVAAFGGIGARLARGAALAFADVGGAVSRPGLSSLVLASLVLGSLSLAAFVFTVSLA